MEDIESKEKSSEVSNEPCRAICETCGKEVTTYVKTEFNTYLLLLIIFTLYFYGLFYGVIILALFTPLFQNVTHNCPYCLDQLLIKKFYPIQFKDKFCWLQYGKCVIILRQIYFFILIGLIFSFGVYYNLTYVPISTPKHEHSHDDIDKFSPTPYYSQSDMTWRDLIKDCGSYVMVENSARANEIFSRKYFKRVVEWKGYFLNAFNQNFSPFDFNPEHLVNINIRMIPSESLKNPDLFLSLDARRYNGFIRVIQSLRTGDAIQFKASFEALGNEWRPHHLHLISIEKIDDFIHNDEKVILFQGVDFNITGHLEMQKEIVELQSQYGILKNDTVAVVDNSTDLNNPSK